MKSLIESELRESAEIIGAIAADAALHHVIEEVAAVCVEALGRQRKILFAGNGGSAADSQHLAGELVSRFLFDRPGLPAIALTTDTSVLTAIGNDYGYEKVFARQIESLGQQGDVFFAFSTSGRSPNILRALEVARQRDVVTIGMTGQSGGEMLELSDFCIRIPSGKTPRIQEGHIVVGHLICNLIERAMFLPSGG